MKPNEDGNNFTTVKVLDKAVQIIHFIAENDHDGAKAADISGRLKLNRTTVIRILNCLCRHGLLEQNPKTKSFMLGFEVYRLGKRVSNSKNKFIYDKIYDIIQRLGDAANETTTLSIRDGDYGLITDSYKKGKGLKVDIPIGEREPLYATSHGKSLILEDSLQEIQDYFKRIPYQKFTPYTLETPEALYQELQQYRKKGCAVASEEYEYGTVGFSAPIKDFTGKISAAVCVSMPLSRLDTEKRDEIIRLTKEAAAEASARLGYSKK